MRLFNAVCMCVPILYSLTSPAVNPTIKAFQLLKSQDDLTIIARLIERDSELKGFYESLRDVTIFAAIDSSFGTTNDIGKPPFTDVPFVRTILRQIVAEGTHPTSTFTDVPQYYSSKLTEPAYVNLSRGKAVIRVVRLNGQIEFLPGRDGNQPSVVIEDSSNLRFEGGILHKLNAPIDFPLSLKDTASAPTGFLSPKYALLNASVLGLLDQLDTPRDITVFTLTNTAFTATVQTYIKEKQCASLSILDYLKYYAVVDGVYYADSFTGKSIKTLNGASVKLSGLENFPNLEVNDVKVAVSDVFIKNGVIHVWEG